MDVRQRNRPREGLEGEGGRREEGEGREERGGGRGERGEGRGRGEGKGERGGGRREEGGKDGEGKMGRGSRLEGKVEGGKEYSYCWLEFLLLLLLRLLLYPGDPVHPPGGHNCSGGGGNGGASLTSGQRSQNDCQEDGEDLLEGGVERVGEGAGDEEGSESEGYCVTHEDDEVSKSVGHSREEGDVEDASSEGERER